MRTSYSPTNGVARTSSIFSNFGKRSASAWRICASCALALRLRARVMAAAVVSKAVVSFMVFWFNHWRRPRQGAVGASAPQGAVLARALRAAKRFSVHPHRLAGREFLQRAAVLEALHPPIAQCLPGALLARKQLLQPVRDQTHGQQGCLALALVAAQQPQVGNSAPIIALAQYMGQGLCISQPQIQPLPGQRVHSVGGIACQDPTAPAAPAMGIFAICRYRCAPAL